MEHKINISPARRRNEKNMWIGHNRYFVEYEGKQIGEFRSPICDSSRWLLRNGASEEDTITSYQSGIESLTGIIGFLSKKKIRETDTESTPRFVAWVPFEE